MFAIYYIGKCENLLYSALRKTFPETFRCQKYLIRPLFINHSLIYEELYLKRKYIQKCEYDMFAMYYMGK